MSSATTGVRMRADKAQMELQQVRLCGVVRGVGRLRATALGDEWQAGKMRAEGARCSQGAVWRAHCFSHQRRTFARQFGYCTVYGFGLSNKEVPSPSRASSPDSARTLWLCIRDCRAPPLDARASKAALESPR